MKFSSKNESPLLHISNVALSETTDAGKLVQVWASVAGEKHLIATLQKEKHEHSILDLYFREEQQVEFSTHGPGKVYLSGYYEPDDEDLSEVDSEEEVQVAKEKPKAVVVHKSPVNQPQKAAVTQKSPAQKAQAAPVKESKPAKLVEDEAEEDDEEEDAELDEKDLDDDEEEDEDEAGEELEGEEDDDEDDEEPEGDDDDDEDDDEEKPVKKQKGLEGKPVQHKPQGGQKFQKRPQQGGEQGEHQDKPFHNQGGNKPWQNKHNGGGKDFGGGFNRERGSGGGRGFRGGNQHRGGDRKSVV